MPRHRHYSLPLLRGEKPIKSSIIVPVVTERPDSRWLAEGVRTCGEVGWLTWLLLAAALLLPSCVERFCTEQLRGILRVLTWIRLRCSRLPFSPPTFLVRNLLSIFCLIHAENVRAWDRDPQLCVVFLSVMWLSCRLSLLKVFYWLSLFWSRTEPHAKAANIYFFSFSFFF